MEAWRGPARHVTDSETVRPGVRPLSMRSSWPNDRGCSRERCPASESWAWHVPCPKGPLGQARLTTALPACIDTSSSLGVSGSVERRPRSARPLALVLRMPRAVLGLADLIQGFWCGAENCDRPGVSSPSAFHTPLTGPSRNVGGCSVKRPSPGDDFHLVLSARSQTQKVCAVCLGLHDAGGCPGTLLV